MAGICCGVVGETEKTATVDAASRTSTRRKMELRQFKIIADMVMPKLPETGFKRQKIEEYSRECESAIKNCGVTVQNRVGISQDQQPESNSNQTVSITADQNPVEPEVPKFGMTSICGCRRDMEDAVSIHPSLFSLGHQKGSSCHFFGVFDGHGCSHVAIKCRERLHEIVKESVEIYGESVEWKETMEACFERMDWEVNKSSIAGLSSNCKCELRTPLCDAVGSTAVVAVVTPEKIIVSNCGDSRAVLCRNGIAVPLSSDHKADRPDELARIEAAGGRVIYWDGPRVLGVLAMSRAIGDNYLKPYVIPVPEVTITDRSAEDECLILASDGLWDVVSNETAIRVVKMCLREQRRLSQPRSPGSSMTVRSDADSSDKACADASILLTKLCLARHSTDNVSVVVVDLRRNKQ